MKHRIITQAQQIVDNRHLWMQKHRPGYYYSFLGPVDDNMLRLAEKFKERERGKKK